MRIRDRAKSLERLGFLRGQIVELLGVSSGVEKLLDAPAAFVRPYVAQRSLRDCNAVQRLETPPSPVLVEIRDNNCTVTSDTGDCSVNNLPGYPGICCVCSPVEI